MYSFCGHFIPILLWIILTCSAFPFYAQDRNPLLDVIEEKRVKVPLKLFALPDPKDPHPFNQANLEVIKAFHKKYPDIELESFSGISIAGLEMDSQILLAIAGGTAPDILYVNFRQSDTYIQQSFLYPLDEFIQKSDFMPEMNKRVPPQVWQVIKRPGPAVDGNKSGEHIWAVPYSLLVRALFYRKDLFEEAGLDPDKPPRSWKELYNYARRLSDPSRKRYGMMLLGGEHAAWDFMPYLTSVGAQAVALDKNGQWTAAFATPLAVYALDFYLRLTCEPWKDADGRNQYGYTSRSPGADTASAWGEGRCGMAVMYLDEQSIAGGVDPALIGIAPFPAGPGGVGKTELNCKMMGIFSGITSRRNSEGITVGAEKIRDAAWKYICFYDSDEARKIRVDKLVELGFGKFMNPKWLKEFGYESYVKYIPREWIDVFHTAVASGEPEPYGKNCNQIYSFMTEPIDKAMDLARTGQLPRDTKERRAVLLTLLEEAAAKTNISMMGQLSTQERIKRNFVAGLTAILVTAIFFWVLYRIWKIFTPETCSVAGSKCWSFKKYKFAYILILPAIISIMLWTYIPMLLGSAITFFDYRFIGDSSFVGLNNIADVLYSKDWWLALWNTLRYMILLLSLGFFLPIILAILLQEVSRFGMLYRIIYYLPAVMSGLVVIYMWKLFFQSDSSGIMNQILGGILGIFGFRMEPVSWLEDSRWAMLACTIPTVWAATGPGCLIYLAALKGIPDELYEAADLDGASFYQKILYIVIPSLKPLIILQFIGAFIAASQNTQMILVMTYGQAGTEVAGLHIFKEAYTNLKFGTAISMAWIFGAALLFFTVYQMRELSKMEFGTAASSKNNDVHHHINKAGHR